MTSKRSGAELGPIDPAMARHATIVMTLVEQGIEAGQTIESIANSAPMREAVSNLRRELGDGAEVDAEQLVLSLVALLASFSPTIDATEPRTPRLGAVGKRPRRSRPSRR